MPDIIVTTPKSQMAAAAAEAADCIAAGGGQYFRRFAPSAAPDVGIGDRVYYVEDGYIRGYAVVSRVTDADTGLTCLTTGQCWPAGVYVFMDATSWRWIRPIPMRGFQGFRYARDWLDDGRSATGMTQGYPRVREVGGWLDPRPQ